MPLGSAVCCCSTGRRQNRFWMTTITTTCVSQKSEKINRRIGVYGSKAWLFPHAFFIVAPILIHIVVPCPMTSSHPFLIWRFLLICRSFLLVVWILACFCFFSQEYTEAIAGPWLDADRNAGHQEDMADCTRERSFVVPKSAMTAATKAQARERILVDGESLLRKTLLRQGDVMGANTPTFFFLSASILPSR